MQTREPIAFVDNGNAPEFFADGLHDVDIIGQTCRFLLFQYRKTDGGVWIKEPVFYCRLPTDAVAPAIGMTISKAAGACVGIAVAGASDMVRNLAHH